jgi:hypothetical protein
MAKPLTDLDKKLQEMAVMNWQQFAALIGEDAIIAAKVCLLRQRGNTYGQIQAKLNLTKDQVAYASCKKCDV